MNRDIAFELAFDNLPGTGWLTRGEAELLWRYATRPWVSRILEVGCYHGRSTCLLAQTGRIVHAVDPFAGFDSDDPDGSKTEAAFRANTAKYLGVFLHRMDVAELSVPLDGGSVAPIHMAYLDGDHTREGTRVQIRKALQFGAGIIAIHDVNDTGDGAGIKEVALEMLGSWVVRVERLAVWVGPWPQKETRNE